MLALARPNPRYFILLVGCFECLAVALALGKNRRGQRDERGLAKALCQSFLGKSSADPAVAVIKLVDGPG